jgi:hypothetical protein
MISTTPHLIISSRSRIISDERRLSKSVAAGASGNCFTDMMVHSSISIARINPDLSGNTHSVFRLKMRSINDHFGYAALAQFNLHLPWPDDRGAKDQGWKASQGQGQRRGWQSRRDQSHPGRGRQGCVSSSSFILPVRDYDATHGVDCCR